MEKKIVDTYKLNRISSLIAKEFGTIPKGEEDEEPYWQILFSIESNILRVHRKNNLFVGSRTIEAIKISLLILDGYIKGIEYDYSRFANEANQAFMQAILMSFDPFTNPEIKRKLKKDRYMPNVKEYFTLPIKCLLRIEKSIKLWSEDFGGNGYFQIIEETMGKGVKDNNKINFSIEEKKNIIKSFQMKLKL